MKYTNKVTSSFRLAVAVGASFQEMIDGSITDCNFYLNEVGLLPSGALLFKAIKLSHEASNEKRTKTPTTFCRRHPVVKHPD
jgi:hypothetical protein